MTAEEQLHETSVQLEKTRAEVSGLSQEVTALEKVAKDANSTPDVISAIKAVSDRAIAIADSLPAVIAPPPAAEGATTPTVTKPEPGPHKEKKK